MTQYFPTIKECLRIAQDKQHVLFEDRSKIRLFGAEQETSYWLYRLNGKVYIGYDTSEGKLPMPYLRDSVFTMSDKDGKLLAQMQLLKPLK